MCIYIFMTRDGKRDEPVRQQFDFTRMAAQILDGDVFSAKKDSVGAALYQIAVMLESQNGTVNLRERDELVASLRESLKLQARLGQIFRTCDHVDLVISTACILANFAGETRKDAVAVVNLGILPVFESHLLSSNSQLRKWAVFAIGNIAWRGPAMRDKLIGSCPGLARNIEASADEYDKRAFFAVKSFFFQQDPQPKFESVTWVIGILKFGLSSTAITDSEMVDTLRIFNSLTVEWSRDLLTFESGSLIKMVIYHLTDCNASVRKTALDAMKGLVKSKTALLDLFTDMIPRQTPRSMNRDAKPVLKQAETAKFNRLMGTLVKHYQAPAEVLDLSVSREPDTVNQESPSSESSLDEEPVQVEEPVQPVVEPCSTAASTSCSPNVLPSQVSQVSQVIPQAEQSQLPAEVFPCEVETRTPSMPITNVSTLPVKKRKRTHVIIHNTFNITCDTFKYYQARDAEENEGDQGAAREVRLR